MPLAYLFAISILEYYKKECKVTEYSSLEIFFFKIY